MALTLARLSRRSLRLVLCGCPHGSREGAAALGAVLQDVQPSAVFLEIDREDLFRMRPLKVAEEPAQGNSPRASLEPALAETFPEYAEAIRWATARRLPLVALDRPQRTTRRRLAQQLLLQPLQLLAARRYWGAVPETASAAAWRASLKRHCPVLHDVMLEERDEFMTYRILLALERLAPSRRTPELHGLQSAPQLLGRRAARDVARVNAALARSLREESCTPQPSGPHRAVLVLCGPAHVWGLHRRLARFLDGAWRSRRLLAENAALLPRLGALCAGGGEEEERPDSPALEDEVQAVRLGPVTTMTSMVWEALASKEQPEQPEPGPVGPLFVHERLRDLSQTPPPVWPVFVLVYVACPLLVFVIIPAQIHLQWLRMGPKVECVDHPGTCRFASIIHASKTRLRTKIRIVQDQEA
ncbi:unnamed protein product [Effrenium voratum]|uniref:Uncharacterized protein n=1 Tax=Effrenium voratum TaxID=2562239 RepID=A0AA36HX20_9DINO|nr:unnamed protein product [Effrenium voratum]CAJ1443069.1 unnamed protein product [Effrenium voratum]